MGEASSSVRSVYADVSPVWRGDGKGTYADSSMRRSPYTSTIRKSSYEKVLRKISYEVPFGCTAPKGAPWC